MTPTRKMHPDPHEVDAAEEAPERIASTLVRGDVLSYIDGRVAYWQRAHELLGDDQHLARYYLDAYRSVRAALEAA